MHKQVAWGSFLFICSVLEILISVILCSAELQEKVTFVLVALFARFRPHITVKYMWQKILAIPVKTVEERHVMFGKD